MGTNLNKLIKTLSEKHSCSPARPRRLFFLIWAIPLLAISCGKPGRLHSEIPGHSFYVRSTDRDMVLVFVHGVFGDPTSTWTNSRTKAFWPDLVKTDAAFDDADIYVHSFVSRPDSQYTFSELVSQFHEDLDLNKVSKHKTIMFVTDGTGGLIVAGLLNTYGEMQSHVRLVYALDIPLSDSDLRLISSRSVSDLDLRGLLPTDGNSFLRALLAASSEHPSNRFYCAYGTLMSGGVPPTRPSGPLASALCGDKLLPFFVTYADISKPGDREAPVYVAFRNAVRSSLTQVMPETFRTRVVQMTKYFQVGCNQGIDQTETFAPALEPNEKIVGATLRGVQANNLKEQLVRPVDIHDDAVTFGVHIAGMDKDFVGNCRGGGSALVMVDITLRSPDGPR